ncbi:hypothetical protein Bbelb_256560 [Branchiostoma belcheri]|nr:hypothetical protein Bbelb_256560 [Branchiostoma belcheri]
MYLHGVEQEACKVLPSARGGNIADDKLIHVRSGAKITGERDGIPEKCHIRTIRSGVTTKSERMNHLEHSKVWDLLHHLRRLLNLTAEADARSRRRLTDLQPYETSPRHWQISMRR